MEPCINLLHQVVGLQHPVWYEEVAKEEWVSWQYKYINVGRKGREGMKVVFFKGEF
jgi:hypothetical protein